MKVTDYFHHSWQPLLPLLNQEPLLTLNTTILPNCHYYPQKENIFRVFRMPLEDIKVVILGQDPYHGPKQATGLAFAVNEILSMPPSLKIMAREIEEEGLKSGFYDSDIPHWKTLESWEEQGVFLLNTALTVQAGTPGSHLQYWQHFIRNTINYIAVKHPCLWMLWGSKAQAFTVNMPPSSLFKVDGYTPDTIGSIPNSEYYNYILRAAHPAAECYKSNAGYLGCNHFLFANTILEKLGKEKINW